MTMTLALWIVFGVALTATTVVTAVHGPDWLLGLKRRTRVVLVSLLALTGLAATWRASVDDERVEPIWLPDAVTWERVPLRVRPAAELDAHLESLREAMRSWNRWIGCPVAVEADEYGPVDVRVTFVRESPCASDMQVTDAKFDAAAYFCPDATADIDVNRLNGIQESYEVFSHELGHVFGLAHDPSGLMAPHLTDHTDPIMPSPKDVAAIRARYCGGN